MDTKRSGRAGRLAVGENRRRLLNRRSTTPRLKPGAFVAKQNKKNGRRTSLVRWCGKLVGGPSPGGAGTSLPEGSRTSFSRREHSLLRETHLATSHQRYSNEGMAFVSTNGKSRYVSQSSQPQRACQAIPKGRPKLLNHTRPTGFRRRSARLTSVPGHLDVAAIRPQLDSGGGSY
jgi:hypothetical protein